MSKRAVSHEILGIPSLVSISRPTTNVVSGCFEQGFGGKRTCYYDPFPSAWIGFVRSRDGNPQGILPSSPRRRSLWRTEKGLGFSRKVASFSKGTLRPSRGIGGPSVGLRNTVPSGWSLLREFADLVIKRTFQNASRFTVGRDRLGLEGQHSRNERFHPEVPWTRNPCCGYRDDGEEACVRTLATRNFPSAYSFVRTVEFR